MAKKEIWVIRDWMGNPVYKDDAQRYLWQFDSYAATRGFIQNYAGDEASKKFTEGTQEWEDEYDGICEDLYAVNVDEDGDELPDTGQYSY